MVRRRNNRYHSFYDITIFSKHMVVFRGPIVVAVVSGLVGSVVGHAITKGRINSKYNKEKKDLLQYIQMQDEIYKQRERQWTQEYKKLYAAYEELEKETVERDYEEFKAPDTNNDDMISRSEFNIYVKKYLSSFPELSEKDFPKFEEFDLNGDGVVSFEEWQKFLYQQKLLESKKKADGSKSSTTSAYADLLNALYEQTNKADSFNSLNQNIASGSRGASGNIARRGGL